jgi:dihydroneopterin aldolase
MDKIFITGLKIEAIIGIYDWERTTKQVVSIDLEMATDIKKAAASDDITDTTNYKAISKHLIEFVGNSTYNLVETLAEAIATIVIDEFGLPWVKERCINPVLYVARPMSVLLLNARQNDCLH